MNLPESTLKTRAIKLSVLCLVATLTMMLLIPANTPVIQAQRGSLLKKTSPPPDTLAAKTADPDKASPAVAFTSMDGPINIPALPGTGGGVASPYPSVINVTGLVGTTATVVVTFNNLSHTKLADMDVLLVSPTGQKFIVMSEGSAFAFPNTITSQTLTFSDAGAAQLNCAANPTTGTYKPTDGGAGATCDIASLDTWPAPAPAGPYNSPGPNPAHGPFQTMNGVFAGANPNGNWLLYVNDDFTDPGTNGSMPSWTLDITVNPPTAASVTVSGRVLRQSGSGVYRTLVTMVDSEGQVRSAMTNGFGYFRFTEVRAGETYVLSVNAKEYEFQNPTQVITVNEDIAEVNFVAIE